MYRKVFSLCVIALVVPTTFSIPFQDCNAEYMITDVDIPGCKKLPCALLAESDQIVHVNMTASNIASMILTQKVYIIMSNIHNEVKTTPTPCSDSWKCPLHIGQDASFSAKIHVPRLPEYFGILHWELFNEKHDKVMCFKVRVEICHDLETCEFINNSLLLRRLRVNS